MSEAAKKAKREYMREYMKGYMKDYRKRNPEKVREIQQRYWEKKAEEAQ